MESDDKNLTGIYLIDNKYEIYFLKIDKNKTNLIEIKQSNELPNFFLNSLPAVCAYFDNKIYLQISHHGCGLIYDPLNLYIYDLITNTWSNATVNFFLQNLKKKKVIFLDKK